MARNAKSIAASQNNVDTPEGFATNIAQDGPGDYGPQFTNADIEDLAIWRRVLTSREVFAIFTAQSGNDLTKTSVSAPPVAPTITA